jgi:PRTRC genetic system protein F
MPRTGPGVRPATAAVSRLGGGAYPIQTLPRLASDIPHKIVPRRLTAADAKVARFLLAARTVQERDIPDTWDSVLDVCQAALDTWVKRELGPLHCLSPGFCMTLIGDTDPYLPETMQANTNEPFEYTSVNIRWHETSTQQWVVGAKLEALEHAAPGMGQAVLAILQRQGCFVYPVFTPEQACYQASLQYWWGEEDEKTALDMNCDNDEDREAMLADMVTRQTLNDAFPAWAVNIPNRKLPIPTLKRLCATVSDPMLGAIAADSLALAQLKLDSRYQPEVDGECLGWGALLSWNEDDVAVRIYDDMANSAYESEYFDHIGELEIPLDAPQALRAWQREMRVRFKAIRLIDSLIYQLAERY